MNWKEEFDELDCVKNGYMDAGDIKKFISTEIIEKLIEDTGGYGVISHSTPGGLTVITPQDFKQQLRNKWL
jgi:hypothetical protein